MGFAFCSVPFSTHSRASGNPEQCVVPSSERSVWDPWVPAFAGTSGYEMRSSCLPANKSWMPGINVENAAMAPQTERCQSVEARQPSANLRAHGADATHRPGRERHKWHDAGRRGPRHAGDGAVRRDQGRQSRLPAVLPDGRFLRDVLRRRRGRLARARHRAHQAREISRQGCAAVRRSRRPRRRISPPADRARPPRRGVRAA